MRHTTKRVVVFFIRFVRKCRGIGIGAFKYTYPVYRVYGVLSVFFSHFDFVVGVVGARI